MIIAASKDNFAALLVLLNPFVGLLAAAAQCIPPGGCAFPHGGAADLPGFFSAAHSCFAADILAPHNLVVSSGLPGSAVIIAASEENTAAQGVVLPGSVLIVAVVVVNTHAPFPRKVYLIETTSTQRKETSYNTLYQEYMSCQWW